jgi:hypothetical protein
MTAQTAHKIGWDFWLKWVLASFIGCITGELLGAIYFPFGWLLVLAHDLGLSIEVTEAVFGSLSIGAMQGILLGLLQYLVLRNKIKHALWWVPATTLGWIIGLQINLYSQDIYLGFALSAALAGIFQTPVLRLRFLPALIWVVASFISWYLGGILVLFAGILAGAMTGLVLIWILNGTK